jgi:hypothetical protein
LTKTLVLIFDLLYLFCMVKKNKYLILMIAAAQLLGCSLYAQNLNQLHMQLGMASVALRDKSMSPLMYTGIAFSGSAAFYHTGTNRTEMFRLSFDLADINNHAGNSCSYTGLAFKNYTLYHKDRDRQNRIVWGWSNNNYFNYYNNENYGNFSERSNYFTTFGPAAAYMYRFKLFGRDLILDVPIDIQLLGFYMRPSYISNNPEGYLDPANKGFMAWLRSIEPFLPHHAWNVGISPGLTYLFRSGNALSLNYHYEYLRINAPEPITQSIGRWYLSLVTQL